MTSATRSRPAGRVIVAALVAASCAMPVAASATGLPNYPGATTQRISPGVRSATTNCGRTITVEKSFKASADPNTIAKWYGSRLPGSRTIDVSRLEDQEGAK
ncbi:MAG: hypothetical protein IAI48_00970, partial [Candidatus Eremiobacteraeota bacterium]|nr:hypothetical protein [Candidatus Eremiobacteraeota bacterium]